MVSEKLASLVALYKDALLYAGMQRYDSVCSHTHVIYQHASLVDVTGYSTIGWTARTSCISASHGYFQMILVFVHSIFCEIRCVYFC